MKLYSKLMSIIGLASTLFAAAPAFATTVLQCPLTNTTYVTMGGDQFTSSSTGLVTNTGGGRNNESLANQGCVPTGLPAYNLGSSGTAGTLNIFPATAAYGQLIVTDSGNSGAFNTTINNASVGQADTLTIPDPGNATASFMLTKGNQSISGINTFTVGLLDTATTNQLTLGAASHTTILSSTAPAAASQTITIPDAGSADTVALLALAQTFTGTETFGAASSIVSKTSTSATDINPPFDNRILGNPVVKQSKGTCSVASVNAGTCIPLALGTGRTITVLNYDIIATGSAATCTGVLLEDTNGSPVVVSTIAAAALTSGTHNIPGLANNVLGVGFGAGSGLTVSQGLQIIVNGSGCTTTTSFAYSLTYSVQ